MIAKLTVFPNSHFFSVKRFYSAIYKKSTLNKTAHFSNHLIYKLLAVKSNLNTLNSHATANFLMIKITITNDLTLPEITVQL